MFRLFRYKKNNVEDYGATVYKTEQEALNGRSSSDAMQKMLDDVGTVRLPDYGYIYVDKEIYLLRKYQNIIGGCHIVTDKIINLFHPLYHNHILEGFTVHMINGGSVVYVGGEHPARHGGRHGL